jgi:energy-coupling factor transporter ATP-binding protein EcfA2
MYTSIRIQNFRGLKDLTIENLGRVNLLVGANNVGKTSVLEALALLHLDEGGSLLQQLIRARGFNEEDSLYGALSSFFRGQLRRDLPNIDGTFMPPTRMLDETVVRVRHDRWGQCAVLVSPYGILTELGIAETPVADLHPSSWIEFQLSGTRKESIAVQFFTDPSTGASLWPSTSHETELDPGTFATMGEGKEYGFFGKAVYLSPNRNVRRRRLPTSITRLRREGQFDPLLDSLRRFDPRIIDITPAVDDELVSVDVLVRENGHRFAVPLAGIGQGVQRIWDILITVAEKAPDTVLIDEIENGVYFAGLDTLWSSLHEVMGESANQLFATTHSRECVEAAVRAFNNEHADDFRLHRLSRRDDEIVVTTYDHEAAEATLNVGVEFR